MHIEVRRSTRQPRSSSHHPMCRFSFNFSRSGEMQYIYGNCILPFLYDGQIRVLTKDFHTSNEAWLESYPKILPESVCGSGHVIIGNDIKFVNEMWISHCECSSSCKFIALIFTIDYRRQLEELNN